jgi:hypothetical protein
MQTARDILNIMQIYYSIILFGNHSHWPVFQEFFVFLFFLSSLRAVCSRIRYVKVFD